MEVTGMDRILKALAEIVGEEHVSDREEELYIYSRDPGLMEPHKPDYVVMPKTTEEVQEIVQLANKEKIPIVPVGGSLSLSGLVIPHRGGIVLDLKRMDRVLEVNEKSRYVVVEGGIPVSTLIDNFKAINGLAPLINI